MVTIEHVLQQCEEAIEKSPIAEVPLGWRVRLWYCMNQVFPADALYRRSVLAYVVAKRTIAAWDTIKHRLEDRISELPHRVIKNCRLLILNEITIEQAQDYDVEDDMEHAMGLFDDFGPAAWSPLACHAAIKCASGYEEDVCQEFFYPTVWNDEFVENCREEDDDWGGWDTHFWAQCVAGGFPDLAGFDANKRREFWQRWLHDDVPSVTGPIESVTSMLLSN